MRKYWILAVLSLAGLWLAGCASECEGDECPRTCANLELTFDPPPGIYPESQQIEVRIDSDPVATMYFTLDGTIPEKDQANTFAFPTPISGIPVLYDNMPIRYFVECEDITTIPESAVYGLDGPAVSTIDPLPGLYAHAVSVSITANEEAEIVYTTDDSPPDKANPNAKIAPSPLKGIEISTDTTIKFSSVDTLGNVEETRVARYEIDVDPPVVAITPQSDVNYEGEVEVEVRATNEIAYMWYTLNGGVPVEGENSPGTKTRFASLPYKATFTGTTVLRYIVVDRVGNREAGVAADGYKEAVFYVDCKPAAVATPPGGVYSQTELDVELDLYPESGVGKFIRDGTGGTQTYSAPIAIADTPTAELEIWAEANMQLISGCQATPSIVEGNHRTEEYLLGGESALYSYNEEFTTNTYIDSNGTTAVVDLDTGVVRLPYLPPERIVKKTNLTAHVGASVPLARVADAPGTYTGLSDFFFLTEGPPSTQFTPGVRGNADTTGLKVYKHANIPSGGGTPSLTFASAYEPAAFQQYVDVATVLADDGTPVIAAARVQVPPASADIEFFSLNVTEELVREGSFNLSAAGSPAVALLNSRGVPGGPSDFLYVSYVQAADTVIAGYQVSDATSYQFENSILIDNAGGPVDMVLYDGNSGDLWSNGAGMFVLHTDCSVSSVAIAITGAVSEADTQADICGTNGVPVPYQIEAFRTDADTYFVFVSYVLAGEIQVSVSEWQDQSGDIVHLSTKAEMLPQAIAGATAGGLSVVPHISAANGNLLVLGVPASLSAQDQTQQIRVYDLYATTNEFNNRYATSNARLEALGSLKLGQQETAYDFVVPVGSRGLFVATLGIPPGGGVQVQGGLQALELDANIRLRAQSAVATSYNINPVSRSLSTVIVNDPVRASGNTDGSIDLEVKIGDGSYQSVATPAQLGVSDGSNEVRWRATLDKGLDSQSEGPILDRLEIQLLYENED